MEEEAGFWAHGWDVVEVAPGGAGAEVDDDDAVAAFGGGVGDVGYAFPGGGQGGAEVEAHVVEVGFREGDGRGEEDGGEDGVIGEVDADQFGAAECSSRKSAIREGCTSSVEYP